MIYLLAKYALLFILTAIAGFVFGRWLTRRSFVDVTESYEELRTAASKNDTPQWERLLSRIDAIPEPKEINLTGVHERLDGLAYAITNLPRPNNMAAVESRLDAVTEVIAKLSLQLDASPVAAKLDRLDDRLVGLETELNQIGSESAPASSTHLAPPSVSSTKTTILKEATFGKKDNLKLISGIGPVLEQLLNDNGIFYFWQIAEWEQRNIESMDERLDTFRGRIERDQWVSQARQLRASAGAAQRPTEMRISA